MPRLDFKEENFDKLPIVGSKPRNEKEEKFLREVLKIEFMNLEQPGLAEKFTYGTTKWFMYPLLMHGGIYRLPRHMIRHIENCQTPIWNLKPDAYGKMHKSCTGYKPRFQCRQLFE